MAHLRACWIKLELVMASEEALFVAQFEGKLEGGGFREQSVSLILPRPLGV